MVQVLPELATIMHKIEPIITFIDRIYHWQYTQVIVVPVDIVPFDLSGLFDEVN